MEKNKKKYLIVARSEFCFDGQVVENDYIVDLQESEDICPHDYDKRDFFGEFVLDICTGTSEEEVLDKVSKNIQMDKRMLKAYELS